MHYEASMKIICLGLSPPHENMSKSHSTSTILTSSYLLPDRFGTSIPTFRLFTSTLTRQPIVFGGEKTYSVFALVIWKRQTCIAVMSMYVVAPPIPKEMGWATNGAQVDGRLDKSMRGFSRIRRNRSMQAK